VIRVLYNMVILKMSLSRQSLCSLLSPDNHHSSDDICWRRGGADIFISYFDSIAMCCLEEIRVNPMKSAMEEALQELHTGQQSSTVC